MENENAHRQSSPSTIRYLPFLDEPPANHDTVFTPLLISAEKTVSHNQAHFFSTFDQQLYWIARDIIAVDSSPEMQPLKNVTSRLGGFHLTKNFLGAIGKIMADSELEEILASIYAENCVPKIMDGTAYSRAIRAHFLIRTALGRVILDLTEFEETERDGIELIL